MQFGSLIMGNRSHPIQRGTTAVLTLHGDKYVAMDAAGTSAVHNKKALELNGNFTAHGSPVTCWRRLRRDALAGAAVLHLEAPGAADWAPGDRLVITSQRGHPTHALEWRTVANVSLNGSIVYLTEPLDQDHAGELVNLTAAEAKYWAEGDRLDYRAAVGLVSDRNVVIEGGDTAAYDRISGLSANAQAYGGWIVSKASYTAAKGGWDPTMTGYWEDGRETYPHGSVRSAARVALAFSPRPSLPARARGRS